jgi:hypothetical protein
VQYLGIGRGVCCEVCGPLYPDMQKYYVPLLVY